MSGSGAVGNRIVATRDPIYQDERLRANSTGLGQFKLSDGTRLVLGHNAVLVVDRYVTSGKGLVKSMALRAYGGSFRFITGNSSHAAYTISTPQGTLGVRGTAFDVTVRRSRTHILLLNGALRFCNNGGSCKVLNRPCEVLIADGGGALPAPRQAGEYARAGVGDVRGLFPIAAN